MENNKSKQAQNIGSEAQTAYNNIPSAFTPLNNQASALTNNMINNYNNAVNTDTQSYGNIMSGYNNYATGLAGIQSQITAPTPYTAQTVSYATPDQLNAAYGDLGSAASGFQNFANTGGFSSQDIADMRARGMSPITAAYGNTISDLSRANTLGGGAANYTAALSQAQRTLPQQLSDAEQGVNANLAQMVQQGELAGNQGLLGVGSAEGGLANTAEGQQLGAAIANQGAGLSAAELNNQMNQEYITNLLQSQGMQLAGLQGQTSLYGATPGLSSTFGNQVLNASGQQYNLFNNENQTQNQLLNTMINANSQDTSQPWYETALGIASDFLNPLGSLFGPSTPSGGAGTGINQSTDYTPSPIEF